jgi:hypothetical protein
MNDVRILVGIFVVVSSIIFIDSIVRDIKRARRQSPYGKVFKKEFAEIIDNIYRAQLISKHTAMNCRDVDGRFMVRVTEYKPEGLEYSTIPMYRCYDVYINDELVCREHIIRELSKDKIWFEFSSKRERDEIITLVKAAHVCAKECLELNSKEFYEKLGLVSKSFFEYSNTEDK